MTDCVPAAWKSVELVTQAIGNLFGVHANFDRSISLPEDPSSENYAKEAKEAVDKLVASVKSHGHWKMISSDLAQRLRVVIPFKKFKPLVPPFCALVL